MNYSSLSEYANVGGMDDPTLGERSTAFYIVSSLISFIATFAIMIPATAVIFTIAHNRDLHKYHYWFVANLMVCDILRALGYAPLFITLNLHKVLKIAKINVSCNVALGIIYIPPVCSGFMVINSAIDAALAITFPLDYENIMTKTKAVIMVIVAWIMAASVILPLIASPELDVKVDDLSVCPHSYSSSPLITIIRVATAVIIIGFNIYLYWSTFRAKSKLKSLVMDCSRPDNTGNSLRALIKKYKSLIRLSITLLLIIVIDGVLRIIRILSIVIAAYYGFHDSSVLYVIVSITLWVEHINHPVVYGFMLREVRQAICCKN